MLRVENLSVSYGAIRALHDVSFEVPQGHIVTLIGSNGAGKSTTLRTISGLIKSTGGQITYDGAAIKGLPAHEIVSRGLCHVPEGRMVFANLTVRENLMMGAYLQRDAALINKERDYVFSVFPRLSEREKQLAGTLSGGEQQMLAIGRALMGRPRFLMLDEPSLGIAPLLVKAIFQQIVEINRERGITILLVEQNANLALEIATFGYVLETGRVILQDQAAALRSDPKVRSAYLGG
ncbi:MAG: ABC transporter ATP-binding protein [Proteobacteria bacterium]|jgi:branched-chain amino acid transport system ATP-binding protein|nr:ABC transporter ATP-binding protein [Pseudomonadota bacterium]MCC6632077.1 ABC transporter ATP-binding protein [Gammaproteobacteria bacterium]